MKKLISLFLVAVLSLSVMIFDVSAAKVNTVSISGEELFDEAFSIYDAINRERVSESRSKIVMDKELMDYAMLRCKELAIKFSHDRPNGESFYSAFDRAYGEDIFTGSSSTDYVIEQWLQNSSSRKDILTDYYKSVGVGAVEVDGSYYWVLIFGIDKENDLVVDRTNFDVEANDSGLVSFKKSLIEAKIRFGNTSLCKNNSTRATISFYNGISYTQIDPSSVTFDSSNKNVCVINKLGKILGLEQGKSTISVTLNGDSYPFLEQDFYVNGEVEDVTLSRSSYTYYRTNKSGSLKLSARVTPYNAGNTRVTWKSSNNRVATVDSNGRVTMKGKGTATSVDSPRVSDSCNIKVVQRVTGVKLNKKTISLKKKKSYRLKATCSPSNADRRSVTWKSYNTKVAKVDKNGKVTGVKNGKTTVRATAGDGSKKYANCTVKVS
ncbi:Ig-like domain-containing protein [Ruminococcus sp.]|uniref:Ig-like domain-containing protein n=1 Tax=Ruminococcus sp. TaxID=41978 RepID=UPI002E8029D9|nr:Ig-like domain-containing protein [Ruminococcus sp.]MEE3439205.1 Ig-like domain-containing protein [Ruminococcus sp.]